MSAAGISFRSQGRRAWRGCTSLNSCGRWGTKPLFSLSVAVSSVTYSSSSAGHAPFAASPGKAGTKPGARTNKPLHREGSRRRGGRTKHGTISGVAGRVPAQNSLPECAARGGGVLPCHLNAHAMGERSEIEPREALC